MPNNAHEQAARLQKATTLANLMETNRISASDAGEMTSEQWVTVAGVAKVNPPSRETQLLVIKIMKKHEDVKAYWEDQERQAALYAARQAKVIDYAKERK